MLGMDTPSLPPAFIAAAFNGLAVAGADADAGADVVLGPSTDGGYYLLAARRPHLALFRGMTWGTSRVRDAAPVRGARPAGPHAARMGGRR